MKAIKLLSILLALGVSAAALSACGEQNEPEVKPSESQEEVVTPVEEVAPVEEERERIPNPVVEYDTVEDAVIQVGHLCPLPTIYEKYNKKASVISNTLIQIVYSDDSGEVLRIREEARPSGDISGNYNSYAYNDTVHINDMNVEVKGDFNDAIYQATWNDGAYSHSISYVNPVTFAELANVISDING